MQFWADLEYIIAIFQLCLFTKINGISCRKCEVSGEKAGKIPF